MLSFITLALAAVNVGFTIAAPTVVNTNNLKARADIDDTTVLQYALTLEHLENAFYSGALAKFDVSAFERAEFPSWVRGRFAQIGEHEASHVAFLEKALGDKATKPCTYKFPYTDPKSFAALSQALEGTGTSAYLGAAKLISNKDYLTAAGSILTTEARHDAWVGSAVNKGPAWNLPYDTPLGLSAVYSIASAFIESCPSTNPTLPVTTYPSLSLSPATPAVGQKVQVKFDKKDHNGAFFVAYYSGLNIYYSDVAANGSTTIPRELANAGTVYAAVVSNKSATPTDTTTLSGFAILHFPFGANVKQL